MAETEQAQIPEVADQAVETHEKTPKESFAELRKAKEDAERQAWQAKKELELIQKQVESQRQSAPQQSQDDDFDFRQLEGEDFPDGKKLVKAFGQVNKKLSDYEKQLQEKEVKIQALEFARTHPDLEEVLTADNIEKYIKSDEDNLESMQSASNPLRKAYSLIKKDPRYLADQQAKTKPVSQEQKKVDEKESKPKTQSMGVRSDAISTAAAVSNSKMTKEQKQALWKEVETARRR